MTGEPDFVHAWPDSRVVFGAGQLASVGPEVERLGARRVQLINDPAAESAAERIADSLGDAIVDRIGEVVMHVPTPVARAAADRACASNAELVVCVGGGSSTGLAKGVAKFAGLPVLAVPTTYAGSEMTSVYGLTDSGRKVTGRLAGCRPRTVIYDPELTTSLPFVLSVTSGLNAVAHCVEALYAPAASPLAQAAATAGIQALNTAFGGLRDSPDDLAARGLALRGAWLGGWVLNVSEMGLHHRLCHVLGGLLDLPHSPLHAVVLPYITAFTAPSVPLAMGMLVDALATDRPEDAGGVLWDVNVRFGVPTSLAAIGMHEADLARAIDAATTSITDHPPVHPRVPTAAAMEALVVAAWQGRRPLPGLGLGEGLESPS